MYCTTDQNLIINCTELVRHPCQLVVSSWEQGIGLISVVDGVKEELDFLCEPGIPFNFIQHEASAIGWLQTIPHDILPKLKSYEPVFEHTIFSLLWIISRYRSACQLFIDSPLLAWLILHVAKSQNLDEVSVANLFCRKRRDILHLCGFPISTSSTLRFLHKIHFKKFTNREFELLKKSTLNHDKLNHLKYIDEKLLLHIHQYPFVIGSRLISKYNRAWPLRSFQKIICDIRKIATELGVQHIDARIGKCGNIVELTHLHDRLVKKLNNLKQNLTPLIQFPPPPLPGTNQIVPITNSGELAIEGALQQHCCTAYCEEIQKNEYYVYKIIADQRCTLGIKINGHAVTIHQLRGKSNCEPTEDTKQMVINWFIRNCSMNHISKNKKQCAIFSPISYASRTDYPGVVIESNDC